MAYYLLKYDDNWADEIDIDGFCVLSEESYEAYQKAVENCGSFYFYIGTNEEIHYESGADADAHISVTKITQDQYAVLQSLNLLEQGFANELIDWILEKGEDEE